MRNVAEKDRSVTVFFCEPAIDMPIHVVKKFEKEGQTQELPKTFGDHLIERLTSTYV